MKKPKSLKIKENLHKRNKGINSKFEKRKEDYEKLKELRQKLKIKKNERIEAVLININSIYSLRI
jgi:hypothetical protein